jgi:hypothetical protein
VIESMARASGSERARTPVGLDVAPAGYMIEQPSNPQPIGVPDVIDTPPPDISPVPPPDIQPVPPPDVFPEPQPTVPQPGTPRIP